MNISLGEQISKKMSAWILVLIMTITAGIFFVSYLLSRQMFNQQVNTWISITPQYTLTNLIDSDYFAIKREVKFLESTGLFSTFVITDNQKRIIARFGEENDLNSAIVPIQDEGKVIWGYYYFTTNFYKFFSPFLISGATFAALVLALYFFIRLRIRASLEKEFYRFNQFLKEIELVTEKLHEIYHEQNDFHINSHFSCNTEQEIINRAFSRLFEEIRRANKSLRAAISEAEQKRFEEELTRTALQVAHDIGSPLAVLEAIVHSTSFALPEESRISIRNVAARIRDITNSLLKKAKHDLLSLNEGSLAQQLLNSLIHLVVAEKRLQYREKTGIEINFKFNEAPYGLFAVVRAADFSRILSNIINNAVEALDDKGNIFIRLFSNDNYAVISIEDNGRGIAKEVLLKLGMPGITYGKSNGLGLGLYHAKSTVETWGGKIELQSHLNQGTLVNIYLPKAQPPLWFVPEIKIVAEQEIVIIDDDKSIHDIWRQRFLQFQEKTGKTVTLKHFYSPQEFAAWKTLSAPIGNYVIYLCDYEFIGFDDNGIDLITQFQINYLSILVTSHFNSEELMLKCEALGIKLLPKDVAFFIPIVD